MTRQFLTDIQAFQLSTAMLLAVAQLSVLGLLLGTSAVSAVRSVLHR